MPVFAYKCNECETKYEIFHKSSENLSEVACPSCGSEDAKKLISAINFSGFSMSKSFDMPRPSCPAGGCESGMCGIN
jgi:putative FmdB family regulatory protein